MPNFSLSVPAMLLLLASIVHAGNQLWEGRLQLQAPHPVEHLEIDAAGYAVTDNATLRETILKRWVAITPVEGKSARWPDNTISYCYESIQARDKLYRYIKAARDKWQAAGLNSLVYKYQQVAEPGRACTHNPQRDHILVISYNDEGKLSSSLGVPPLDNKTPETKKYKGPFMMLSDAENVGMLDVAANVAHELGHVWGLVHEHQNQYFWLGSAVGADPDAKMPDGMNYRDDPPFNKLMFRCSALKDYESTRDRVLAEKPEDVDKLCTKHSVAMKHKFSAMDWLPIAGGNLKLSATGNFVSVEDIDWMSIMLYPSGAGARGDAAPPGPGEELGSNDHREHVLVLADGSPWHGNFVPSEGDIKGIKYIYEDHNFPEGEPVLISDKGSKWNDKFKSAIGQAKCHVIPDE
ncbi:hypothetical protein ACHAQA_009535 [Verticillium albo-atrum]